MNHYIYLDNNATSRPSAECIEAVYASMHGGYGNPSSKHLFGDNARQLVNDARKQVAALVNAAPAEIVFTSGATESNYMAVMAARELNPGRNHVVLSAIEHPSVLALVRTLEQQGMRVSLAPADAQGRVDLAALSALLTDDTALLSLMWANNETGVLQPLEQALGMAHARGILVHSDAVQAVGKVPVDITAVPIDLMSFTAHKMHGPMGIGALYVRKGIKLPALFDGHQERRRRGGTENVPGIVGFGVACELAGEQLAEEALVIARLRDRLEQGVVRDVPFATINGAKSPRIPNTTSITFGTLPAEALLSRMEKAGIYASQGAACAAGQVEPSHVLLAMGLSEAKALATVRFSLSHETTEEKIDQVLRILPELIGAMAGMAA